MEEKDWDIDPELASVLQEHYQAIEEEFDAIKSGDIEAIREKCVEKVSGALLGIVGQMVHLAKNADSESVQLNAQKACLAFVLGDEKASGKENPVDALVKKLTRMEPSESD